MEPAENSRRSVRLDIDPDGVATVWLDLTGKSVNTLTPQLFVELNQVVGTLEEQRPKGAIFASGKARSFVVGADLFELMRMNRNQLETFLADGQALFDRIANLSFPTVAAINGDCLGGGLELALACDFRAAADDCSINIGLPEVKLGIIPGWGGTVRLPRLIGLEAALPLLLSGKTLPPMKAKDAGIVDDLAPRDALVDISKRIIGLGKSSNRRSLQAGATPSDAAADFLPKQREAFQRSSANYPAPLRLIDVVRAGIERGAAAGLEAERKGLSDLIETDTAKNLLRLFFLRQGAKKAIAAKLSVQPREIKNVAVLGGGTMGAGIVHALLRAAIAVRLIEVSPHAASEAASRIQKLLDDEVKGGRLSASSRDQTLGRLAVAADWTDIQQMDLIIEAVVEQMPLKRKIFAELDAAARPDCLLATNTSSLSVTEMAVATAHPNRVVGLHFFNPVPRMPLVEVVQTKLADERALATAAAVATKLGKTPVLVNDAPGFIVNRVLIPYLAEAIVMAAEGNTIVAIDDAMKQWGMPMGPFELLDEIGLDVSDQIIQSLGRQLNGRVPEASILKRAVESGWLGRKSGRGFYQHAAGKTPGTLPINAELVVMVNPGRANESPEAIQWRLALPMANEAARLLEERVVDSTDAIDLATVLGAGLAPFRGGLAHFIDSAGINQIVSHLSNLAQKHGPRFDPAPLLRRLLELNKPLSDFAAAIPA